MRNIHDARACTRTKGVTGRKRGNSVPAESYFDATIESAREMHGAEHPDTKAAIQARQQLQIRRDSPRVGEKGVPPTHAPAEGNPPIACLYLFLYAFVQAVILHRNA